MLSLIIVLLIILGVAFVWHCCTSKREAPVQHATNPQLHINPFTDHNKKKIHDAENSDSFMITLQNKEDSF